MAIKPLIGCLALQGCVDRHKPHIETAGADFLSVKTPKDFEKVDAFILPGGESTTMLRLIQVFDLWESLLENFRNKPVWGICAGTILMAEKAIVNDNLSSRSGESQEEETQKSFGLLPISVLRNGYGTQLESVHTKINDYTVSFIRAPVIKDAGDCEILAEYKGSPVWVKGQGEKAKYMASSFHPELTHDYPSPMHRAFVDMVKSY